MVGFDRLKASDGTGLAVLAHIESTRSIGGTVIDVDSVDNWPTNFIVTTGTLLGTGLIDPSTITEMYGHITSGDIIIDGFMPGSTDAGNTIGQVAVIKPSTGFADWLIETLRVEHGDDGKHGAITSTLIKDANGNELLKFTGTASAVNEMTITNAATGNSPQLSATGGDTNIDVKLVPKGTGAVTNGTQKIDWWQELGRTTLTVAGDSISVASFPARKYLRVLATLISTGGTISAEFRFNGDTASNYSYRHAVNFGGPATSGATTFISANEQTAAYPKLVEAQITNLLAQEKLWVGHTNGQNTAGAASEPIIDDQVGKWANTSVQITRIDVINVSGTGDYAIGSELVVLGHD